MHILNERGAGFGQIHLPCTLLGEPAASAIPVKHPANDRALSYFAQAGDAAFMRYRISHTTKYAYSAAVPLCQNKAHLAPRESSQQRLLEYSLLVLPEPSEVSCDVDFFGNRVEYFAIHQAHHGLTVQATSVVELDRSAAGERSGGEAWETVAAALQSLRDDASLEANRYRFPSDLVRTGNKFAALAAESFYPGRGIVEASIDLMHRIHREFEYTPGATSVSTPVEESLRQKAGVCQDFAHVAIAAVRSLGLAARYVSGYLRTAPPPGKPRLVGADASHAWCSVFCGEAGWIDLDPTNDVVPANDHVTVALGRDYADVCPIQGVFIGGGEHTMSVAVDVEPITC